MNIYARLGNLPGTADVREGAEAGEGLHLFEIDPEPLYVRLDQRKRARYILCAEGGRTGCVKP